MSDFINTVDVIGDDVLTAQIVGKTVTEYKNDCIANIRQYAFANCTKLAILEAPNVTTISTEAFRNCAITKADFPLVTEVNAWAFTGCTNLETINFPLLDNARLNGPGYVFDSASFAEAVFPKLQSAGNGFLQKNKKLVKVDFGVITKMADIFAYNTALETIIIRTNSVCSLSSTWGLGTCDKIKNGTCFIYVPSTLVEEYKVATNWSTYASQFRALEDYTVDGTITGEIDKTKI